MLRFDGGTGVARIQLVVRPALTAVIPNCEGHANLLESAHNEVLALVDAWIERSWVEKVKVGLKGDYAVVVPSLSVYTLEEMDIEWCALQLKLLES